MLPRNEDWPDSIEPLGTQNSTTLILLLFLRQGSLAGRPVF